MFSLGTQHGRRCRAFLTLVALALGGASGPARAATPPAAPSDSAAAAAEVERHAELGKRHFDHGRYQDAIAEYREAYELRASPIFLHEIAEAYRQLGIVDRALFFYDRYLEASADAPDRAEVEGIISELERHRRGTAAEPNRTPLQLSSPTPAAGAPADLADLHDLIAAPAGATRPIWKRWWFWGAVAALVAAGVTTALLATSGQSDAVPPATDLGTKRFF